MAIIEPQFIVLDSSQLADWARDKSSSNRIRLQRAVDFEKSISNAGAVILLSWHHVEELFGSENIKTIDEAIYLLKTLPMTAFIKSRDNHPLGSVIDILAAEIDAAHSLEGSDVFAVRDSASHQVIELGSPSSLEKLEELKVALPLIWQRRRKQAETVAISRSEAIPTLKITLAELMRSNIQRPESAKQTFGRLRGELAQDIQKHGDKRIERPPTIASDFFGKLYEFLGDEYPQSIIDLCDRIFLPLGIDVRTLDPKMTLSELTDMAEFRRRLAIASNSYSVGNIGMKSIPSWIVHSALRNFYPKLERHEGGELTDIYLATLALYADLTFVDKRTMEGIRRARSGCDLFRRLLRRVEKSIHYSKVPALLKKMPIETRGQYL